ncbi:putative 26S proteasome regulatory subunit [Marasmius tenuissimus]|uniref:26S proteasome regulatory subunit n=1 Tax=Marasmius tenuissimus TaxID=585030 RepID=A0ABR3A8X4_9AGAR
MGFILPSPDSPAEKARALMAQKQNIETELDTHLSILKANNCTLRSPLVDGDGFPRADIDIFAVRGARVRIIELRNDLEAITNEIGKALEAVYDPSIAADNKGSATTAASASTDSPKPFAKVDGVAPGGPAAEAVSFVSFVSTDSRTDRIMNIEQGLKREDLVVKFGPLIHTSFTSNSLQPLVEVVSENENVRKFNVLPTPRCSRDYSKAYQSKFSGMGCLFF